MQVSGEDGVMVVEINRPDQRNCVNPKTASELHRSVVSSCARPCSFESHLPPPKLQYLGISVRLMILMSMAWLYWQVVEGTSVRGMT